METLGSTSAINSDKTGTLTMNQMTAVEVLDPVDRYTISGIGYGLEGKVHHAAGTSASIDDAVLPYIIASDAKLVDGKVVGDPTEGALLVLAHKAGLDIEASREQFPRLATLPFDPTYKLMATFNSATDSSGKNVVRCFVKGAAPAVMGRAATALAAGASVPWDDDPEEAGRRCRRPHGGRGAPGDGRGLPRSRPRHVRCRRRPAGLRHRSRDDVPRRHGRPAPRRVQGGRPGRPERAGIRVRMVTGDDVITGAAIAKQLGIPGTAMLGYGVRRTERTRSGWPASTTSASSDASRPSTRCCSSRRSGRRATSSP